MYFFGITAAAAFLLSLLAKWIVDVFLHTRVAVLGSFAGFEPTHNPGVAFGVRLPAGIQEVVIVAALIFVCVLAAKTKHTLITGIGYGLIVGGALANVLDRLSDGFVTDFIQIGSFAIFNVADSCISIGVMFLLADIFGLFRRR